MEMRFYFSYVVDIGINHELSGRNADAHLSKSLSRVVTMRRLTTQRANDRQRWRKIASVDSNIQKSCVIIAFREDLDPNPQKMEKTGVDKSRCCTKLGASNNLTPLNSRQDADESSRGWKGISDKFRRSEIMARKMRII
jgi:hypothetical protein